MCLFPCSWASHSHTHTHTHTDTCYVQSTGLGARPMGALLLFELRVKMCHTGANLCSLLINVARRWVGQKYWDRLVHYRKWKYNNNQIELFSLKGFQNKSTIIWLGVKATCQLTFVLGSEGVFIDFILVHLSTTGYANISMCFKIFEFFSVSDCGMQFSTQHFTKNGEKHAWNTSGRTTCYCSQTTTMAEKESLPLQLQQSEDKNIWMCVCVCV